MYVYVLFLMCAIFGYIDGAEYMQTKASFLNTCERKDPNFKACTTKSTELLFKQLSVGIEGLEDLHFDPMKLNKLQLLGDGGPVSINTTITKGVISGLSSIVVGDSFVDPTDYSWITKIYLPKIRVEGHYRMQGRILVLPLVGSGNCWFEPSGMHITINTKTHLYEKFGHIFYNITGVQIDYTIGGLKLNFDNLFDGSRLLDESTNQYLNENWRPVSESLKPIIANAIESIFFTTLNKIFRFIPADYFVSDIQHPSELYAVSTRRTRH